MSRRRLLASSNLENYIDLGLPSGTLWAKGNLCKNSNENYYIGDELKLGTYVSWGNVFGINEGEVFSVNSDSMTYGNTLGSAKGSNILFGDTIYDIVQAKLGGLWSLPSTIQLQELIDCTDFEWVSNYKNTGIAGAKFMKKTDNSVYVFFRASGSCDSAGDVHSGGNEGCYWSNKYYSSNRAYSFCFYNNNNSASAALYIDYRYYYFSIRPVCPSNYLVTGYRIDLTNAAASPTDMIIKPAGASMNLSPSEDAIAWIHGNTKIVAANLELSNGKLVYKEVSKTNKTKWADGTTISSPSHYDFFVKLPMFWWRCVEVETDVYDIQFSKTLKSYDEKWNYWEGNTFIGVYEGYVNNNNLYSRTDVLPDSLISQTDFKTYARNRGTGYTLISYEAHCIMALLGYGWIGQTDVQSVCGRGAETVRRNTGGRDSLGMTDTVAGGNGDAGSTNFWGIENWWGALYEFIDNIKTANGYSFMVSNSYGISSRSINTGLTSSDGCIGKMKLGRYGDLVPTELHSNSSYNNGYCDLGYVNSSSNYVSVRSGLANLLNGGLGYFSANYSSSIGDSLVTSRLQYKGDYIVDTGKLDPEISWAYSYFEYDRDGFINPPVINNPHNLDIIYGSNDPEIYRDYDGNWYTNVERGYYLVYAHFPGNDTYNECFIIAPVYFNNAPT